MSDRFRFRVWDPEDKNYTSFPWFAEIHNSRLEVEYPKILEQCTGLKDKHGTLIFEGDIVLINKKQKQVYFFNGAFFCKDIKQYEFNGADPAPLHYWIANEYDIEIIGNFHEIK